MKRLVLGLALIGLLAVEPFLGQERFSNGLEERAQISVSEFFLRFFGEIRYTLASFLWLKTEIYHHELNLSISSRIGAEDPKKVGELLAICRLVTRLDPGFVQAYDVGAWRLAAGLGRFDDGFAFLKEGLSHTPDSPLLNSDMGT